jgi:prolyl-tRNA synthetase
VRGDREINEAKLGLALGADVVQAAPQEVIERVTGAPVGFAGPVGLEGVEIIADHTVEPLTNIVVGGNESDVHLRNVNIGRDFRAGAFHDIVRIQRGDLCARCGAELSSFRGIEVSQAFKLGTKYSASMKATFLDEDGVAKPFVMGCYGLGVSRTVAAIIEQHSDKDGIVWPLAAAPFAVEILAVNTKSEECRKAADELYEALVSAGVDVLYDDRSDTPGVKFKDADLVGLPLRVTVGDRSLKRGAVEARVRRTGEETDLPRDRACEEIQSILSSLA